MLISFAARKLLTAGLTNQIDLTVQIASAEFGSAPFAMQMHARGDVDGDPDIERAVRAVGHDIDPAARHRSVLSDLSLNQKT